MSATKQQQLDLLRQLAQGLPLPVRMVGEPWADDHILCCTIGILPADAPEVEVELWWVGWEGCAAVRYAEHCEQARADLATVLASTIEALEDDEDDDDAGDELGNGDTCPN